MRLKRLWFPVAQLLVSLVLFGYQLVMLFFGMLDWTGLLACGWQVGVSFYHLVKAIVDLFKNGGGTSTPSE
ncbi:MAG: hypothetical protein CW346_18965 [Bacillaceae bacterium]|nr:hypothetical protein [Bacillaceae bacterium]